jgi:hypothetical protein
MADYIKLNPKFRESLNTGVVERFLGKTCDKGEYNSECKEEYECDGCDVEICPKKLRKLIRDSLILLYKLPELDRPGPHPPEPEPIYFTGMARLFQIKDNKIYLKPAMDMPKLTLNKTFAKKTTTKKATTKKPTAKKKVAKKTKTKKATTKK